MAFLESLALSGVSSFIGGLFGTAHSKSEQNYNSAEAALNRQFQRTERLATQEFNKDMWELNNEYNSPSAQVQRLEQAGINPNAAFGSYSPVASEAVRSTPQGGSQASYSSSLGSSLMSTTANAIMQAAQIENIQADTANKTYELHWNKLSEKERYDNLMNMNDEQRASIAKIFSDIGMNDFNRDLQERTFSYFAAKSEAELKVMEEQLNKLRNESLEILKNIDLKDAQILDTLSSASLKNSQTEGQQIDNALQSVALQFSQITGMPLGASEEQALFKLWSEGKWNELNGKLMLNASNSNDKFIRAAGSAQLGLSEVGALVDSLFEGVKKLFSN